MQLNVGKEVAAMQEMPVAQLRNRYAEVFDDWAFLVPFDEHPGTG